VFDDGAMVQSFDLQISGGHSMAKNVIKGKKAAGPGKVNLKNVNMPGHLAYVSNILKYSKLQNLIIICATIILLPSDQPNSYSVSEAILH